MRTEILIALGIPLALHLITTAMLLKRDVEMPLFLQCLNSRDALLWNTLVDLAISVEALRWALSR